MKGSIGECHMSLFLLLQQSPICLIWIIWIILVMGGKRPCSCCFVVYIGLCLPPNRTWHKVNDLKIDYSRDLGEGKVGNKPRLEPCWSMLVMAHLAQCGPNEPSWTWTQIWVQACMPDYSLNWTARSSAIQGGQRCQWCSQRRGLFSLMSAFVGQCPLASKPTAYKCCRPQCLEHGVSWVVVSWIHTI